MQPPSTSKASPFVDDKDKTLTGDAMTALNEYFSKGAVTQLVRELWGTREDFNKSLFTVEVSHEVGQAFQYEGFDPNLIFSLLLSRAQTIKALKDDIVDLSVMFIIRGNNIDKMQNTMSEDGRNRARRLKARYDIRSSLQASLDRRKVITLSRICATLPAMALTALKYLQKDFIRPIMECANNVHVYLRHSVALPYWTQNYLKHGYLLSLGYAALLGSIIGDKKDTLGSLKKYVRAAHESKKLSESSTREVFRRDGACDPPLNWNELVGNFERHLADSNDDLLLKDLVPLLDPCFSQIIPPVSWYPFIPFPPGFP